MIGSVLALGVAGLAAGATPALAQAGPAYAATPPTLGALYRDGPSDRWLLGGTWLYRADPTDAGVAAGWWRSVSSTGGWSTTTVPNSFNAGDLSQASMNGSVGWYRRDFTIPATAFASYVPARFRSWIVRFESVNYRATVWLNGRKIGFHAGEYLPFEFALKGVRAGVNRLVVRVDSRRTNGDLPPGNGGWWNYGGINQEVYLRSVQIADMSPVVIRPILPCPTCAAQIQEQVTVRNLTGAVQTLALRGTYGSAALNFGGHTLLPGGTWAARATVTIPAPHLWSPTDPFLYRAGLTLSDAHGRTLEGYTDYSGIRSIAVGAGGQLLLNGRVLNLRGFDLHEVNLQSGAALSPSQLQALVGWDRELGGEDHPGPLPAQPADRGGGRPRRDPPVVRDPGLPGELELSDPLGVAELRAQHAADQHPHQREPPLGAGVEHRQRAADATARRRVPLHRRRGADRPSARSHAPGGHGHLQLARSRLPGRLRAAGRARLQRLLRLVRRRRRRHRRPATQLSPFLDFLHGCYPSKPLMITEFGFEGSQNGPPEQRGTYQYQTDQAAFHLGVFASKPYIAAAMWFALQDFPAKPGWSGGDPFPHPPFVEKGEIDLQGNPVQPLFSTVQSIYLSTQQIAPAPAPARRRTKATKRSTSRRRGGSAAACAITRKPSRAVSFLPSSVARAR